MPSGFDQYGTQAGAIADSYGLNRSIFFGLIDAESSWNPNASPGTSSAYGFTQLLKGTAAGLGVDRFDPTQNLKGGAAYLSSLLKQTGGDYTQALAAYHDGAHAIGQHGGYQYADKVLTKAKSYAGGQALVDGENALVAGVNALLPGAGSALKSALGIAGIDPAGGAGGGCGVNPICYLQQWIESTGFFQRLSLAILAFIVLAAGFYLMNRTQINAAVKTAALT